MIARAESITLGIRKRPNSAANPIRRKPGRPGGFDCEGDMRPDGILTPFRGGQGQVTNGLAAREIQEPSHRSATPRRKHWPTPSHETRTLMTTFLMAPGVCHVHPPLWPSWGKNMTKLPGPHTILVLASGSA